MTGPISFSLSSNFIEYSEQGPIPSAVSASGNGAAPVDARPSTPDETMSPSVTASGAEFKALATTAAAASGDVLPTSQSEEPIGYDPPILSDFFN